MYSDNNSGSDEDGSSVGSMTYNERGDHSIDHSMEEIELPNTNMRDKIEVRRMVLIKTFSLGNTEKYNNSTMKSINRAVRLVAIPRIRFWPTSKVFGSFEQPDFSDPNCWVNKVFDKLSNLKNASDKKKAAIWMTYRNKVKEQFSLHRSAVTSKIKNEFKKGKFSLFVLQCCYMVVSITTNIIVRNYRSQEPK